MSTPPAIEATDEDILSQWNNNELTFEERDVLLSRLQEKGLFPRLMEAQDEWESEAGLYPDIEDPRFTEKLMRKLEFAENKQPSIREQQAEGGDTCNPAAEFELTPVQRFIGRYLSPQCPYQSALLYHGVGVGKTCAAVTVAEAFLRSYPRRPVIIVAPRNIQAGFKRTIFDSEADSLTIPEEDDYANVHRGCTGNTYLKKAGVEYEKDRAVIQRRVTQIVSTRYMIMGYQQFLNYIEGLLKAVPAGMAEEAAKAAKQRILRREFSGRLLIIDEAHNLRDSPGDTGEEDKNDPGGEAEISDHQAAKRLTPLLMRLLDAAEGTKLLLLTGTPMYNSFKEIIFLLNLMLINDKKATLSERDIFLPTGQFRKAKDGRKGGEELLGAVASAYVSFMRGENPLSFPIRLPPKGVNRIESWPTRNPAGDEIGDDDRERMFRIDGGEKITRLPLIPVEYEGSSNKIYQQISEEAIEAGGLGLNSIGEMVQGGNWLFPTSDGAQVRDMGFDACFQDVTDGRAVSKFKAKGGDGGKWLLEAQLGTSSAKAKLILGRAKRAQGIVFVYSQYIKSGVLPLALALEANGYTNWKEDRPLLEGGAVDGLGRQCAVCERREKEHAGARHRFVAAKYILLTGNGALSPNNAAAIKAARASSNKDGREIKVVLGSSVASEGVDFKFVREIYMFDSWFHLNKMEQVLGRGIRYCSHSLLPPEKRNCTIHLLVNRFGGDNDTETCDMYMYRAGITKAMQIGRVTRALKRYALDCNLNRDAIVMAGLDTQEHIDSQGELRGEVNVNDTPYTNLCDWIETCEYTCARPVEIGEEFDTSTYDEYAVRWRESQLKRALRGLFETREQPVFQLAEIQDLFSAVPSYAVAALLSEIVGNKAFRLRVRGVEGYILYRNGYYLFQPDYLSDIRVPLALRVADVPVKRDSFEPTAIRVVVEGRAAAAAAAAATSPGATNASGAVSAEAAAALAPVAPPSTEGAATLSEYWNAIQEWATAIQEQRAPKEDIPESVKKRIAARYEGDDAKKELDSLIMINWFYDHILSSTTYTEEQKAKWSRILGQVLLEFVWDESLRGTEQQLLLKSPSKTTREVATEQLVQKSGREAFRFIDPMTGVLRYMCGDARCEESVRMIFEERNPTDPVLQMKVNTNTTGPIYGFMVPKSKEARLIFKTNVRVPAPGVAPEKGSECANISTISYHIQMLKDIGNLLETTGYPRFLLVDEVLEEKARRKAEGRGRARDPRRSFENAIRACALKEIILRWMDLAERGRGDAGRRYFYRPIAALKTGHKGVISK